MNKSTTKFRICKVVERDSIFPDLKGVYFEILDSKGKRLVAFSKLEHAETLLSGKLPDTGMAHSKNVLNALEKITNS